MASRSVEASNGTRKRPYDEASNVLTRAVNTKNVPAYDPKTEQVPNSILRSEEYKAYNDAKMAVKALLLDSFQKFDGDDRVIEGLKALVEERMSDQNLERITLCMTGAMGTGKSASLNSLFGVGDIARSKSSGDSCTLASCRYQGERKTGQKAPYLAEIKFFTKQERKQILQSYLIDYHGASARHHQEEDAGRGSQLTDEEKLYNQGTQNEVIDAFVSLFGNQEGFGSRDAVRASLSRAESDDDDRVLSQLCEWCDRAISEATQGEPFKTILASTSGILSKELEQFTAVAKDEYRELKFSLTPMVSVIDVYFDCSVTDLGIVFLDTPGTSDCNKIRRMSAMQCRRERTHTAIFSHAIRAQSDSGISKEVTEMEQLCGAGRAIIVITKTDEIDDHSPDISAPKERVILKDLQDDIERIGHAANANEIEQEAAADDEKRALRLSKEGKELEIKERLGKNAETAYRISLRNRDNKKCIDDKLRYITPTQVPIFAVSNREYTQHTKGYQAKSTPVLDVEQTGIPSLRRSICALPNEARFNEVHYQQSSIIPSLLGRIELYTARTPLDRKLDMEYYVHKPRENERYQNKVTSFFKELEDSLHDEVLESMYKLEKMWSKQADTLCDVWDRYTTGTFRNLLNKDGRRKGTKNRPGINLSGEVLGINAATMTNLFRVALSSLKQRCDWLQDDILLLVDTIVLELKDEPNAAFMGVEPFYNYLEGEKPKLRKSISEAHNRLSTGLSEITRKIALDEEDAHIVVLMSRIYSEVRVLKPGLKDEHGTKMKAPKGGWPAWRLLNLRKKVTNVGIWNDVCDNAKDELSALLKHEREILYK